MPPLHVVEVERDACGNGCTLRGVTLAEAHGKVGSFWPVKVDGKRGSLRFASPWSHEVVFVEAS